MCCRQSLLSFRMRGKEGPLAVYQNVKGTVDSSPYVVFVYLLLNVYVILHVHNYVFQEEALEQLKLANPDGRFWIKLDGTDVKTALMESVRGEWNGDEDLGDGQLQSMRKEYDQRVKDTIALIDKFQTKEHLSTNLSLCVNSIDGDVVLLNKGFASAVKVYTEKYKASNTSVETLKNCNWNVVEFQTLLQESQAIKSTYEDCFTMLKSSQCTDHQFKSCQALLKDSSDRDRTYLRNLYKKKRIAASHIEVIMISDEKRNCKPYALPVKFVPCQTRELNKEIKEKMTEKGLKVVGKHI